MVNPIKNKFIEHMQFFGLTQETQKGYKMNDDPAFLKKAYEEPTERFPDSPWAKLAIPYRLL